METLARLCHRSPKDMDALVRARSSAMQKACDHVALSQARLFNAAAYRRRASLVGEIPHRAGQSPAARDRAQGHGSVPALHR